MAKDPNPALRADLLAAEAVLDPQLRGLTALLSVVSPDLAPWIQHQIDIRQRRRDLIQAVLDGLDGVVAALGTLEGDGYPVPIPGATIPEGAFEELEGEVSDIDAGASLFDGAASVDSDPVDAPHSMQPIPPE